MLDEADLISMEKDRQKDVLYFLSRSKNKYAVLLLSNNPRFLSELDESTRSSLQAERLHFKNYTAGQILSILKDRAAEGLKSSQKALLAEIAALTINATLKDIFFSRFERIFLFSSLKINIDHLLPSFAV